MMPGTGASIGFSPAGFRRPQWRTAVTLFPHANWHVSAHHLLNRRSQRVDPALSRPDYGHLRLLRGPPQHGPSRRNAHSAR